MNKCLRIKGKSVEEIYAQVQCGYLSLNPFPNEEMTVQCLNVKREGFPLICDYYKEGKCDYRDTKKTLNEIVAERAVSFATSVIEAINYADSPSSKRNEPFDGF